MLDIVGCFLFEELLLKIKRRRIPVSKLDKYSSMLISLDALCQAMHTEVYSECFY